MRWRHNRTLWLLSRPFAWFMFTLHVAWAKYYRFCTGLPWTKDTWLTFLVLRLKYKDYN